jgi:3-hydroxybutyryl-CoA dehydrogenase
MIKTVAVIGAGQMGAGIAQVSAAAGYRVLLSDIDKAAADKGRAEIEKRLTRARDKGDLSADDAVAILGRVETFGDLSALGEADLVIEAATENETVKHKIFGDAAARLDAEAILATNTSSISITRLARSAPDPKRFVGVHFFNPVPVMALVELIPGLATAPETIQKVDAFAVSLGKTVVTSADSPGFIVNRILLPMLNEACFALGEGVASIRDIDTAVTLGLAHPMGPLTLADFVGLDTCLAICRVLHEATGDPKFRPAPLLVKYVEAGWLGRKSGRGFYDYSGDAPVPTR